MHGSIQLREFDDVTNGGLSLMGCGLNSASRKGSAPTARRKALSLAANAMDLLSG